MTASKTPKQIMAAAQREEREFRNMVNVFRRRFKNKEDGLSNYKRLGGADIEQFQIIWDKADLAADTAKRNFKLDNELSEFNPDDQVGRIR